MPTAESNLTNQKTTDMPATVMETNEERGARLLYQTFSQTHEDQNFGAGRTHCLLWSGLNQRQQLQWLLMWKLLEEQDQHFPIFVR